MRAHAQTARDDLRRELGPEYADLELTDLDPRKLVSRHLREALHDEPEGEPRT